MIDLDLEDYEISEPEKTVSVTAAKVFSGKIIPPQQHILLLSSDDWEVFIEEWAHHKKTQYKLVTKLGGANDFGIDVACFHSDHGFEGYWDNFQCKYYKGKSLEPSTAIPEIGKLLWHVFREEISLPKNYYFFAPKDCGPSLKKLLLSAPKLKAKLFDEWDNWCAKSITTKKTINLDGDFFNFVDEQDFSIFQYKPTLDVIDEHRHTPYYHARFGGGLPDRPDPSLPPEDHLPAESRYIEQLFEAYSDHSNTDVNGQNLESIEKFEGHFKRQRESFFHAESLRNFARDTVPHGTFESLQNEIHSGVVDTCEDHHDDGFARLKAVAKDARELSLDANGLIQVTKTQDRLGICHQLANVDRLIWVSKDE